MGTATHDDRFRETGLLAFETLIDSNLAVEAVKIAADRARPYQTDGSGHFEAGPTRWSSGFPFGPRQQCMGHTIFRRSLTGWRPV